MSEQLPPPELELLLDDELELELLELELLLLLLEELLDELELLELLLDEDELLLDELELELLDEELELPPSGSITAQDTCPLKLPSVAVPWTPYEAIWPTPRLLFQLQQGRIIRFEGSPGTSLITTFQPLNETGSPKSTSTAQELIDPEPLLVSVPSTWKPAPQLPATATVQLALELPPPLELLLEELLDELDEELLLDDELDDELLEELELDELELLDEELELLDEELLLVLLEITKCCAETGGTV